MSMTLRLFQPPMCRLTLPLRPMHITANGHTTILVTDNETHVQDCISDLLIES